MSKDSLSGKLAVILHADIADSTVLVQQDERLTHERIQDAFRRLSETIEKYQGHVRELRGDALLADFERPSDAVTAALAFQAEHTSYIEQLIDDIRPVVRIGIAMGEVIIADNTVTGSGVVLAQRVEQLSEPGGICITAAIHEGLPKRLPFDQADMGEQQVKGFDEPVRVYRVKLKPGQALPQPEPTRLSESSQLKRNSIIALVTVALVVVVGSILWLQPWAPEEEPASIERMAFPLPDKPSIAVLPFTNMSGDAEQEYFADGMTDDLITDLSKISGLFVIARNSTFTYKGKPVQVRQVAEELGVRYVLEGSVRRAGDQVRINAQLIDATSGGHIWAERYDGSLQDIFALQDQVTRQIVTALKVSLTAGEEAQQARHTTDNAEAHDAFLQGWAYYKLGTRADLARAKPFFEEAIQLDPGYARAHAALAVVYWDAFVNDWTIELDMLSFEAEEAWEEHLELAMKVPNSIAHILRSRVLVSLNLYKEAAGEAEKAVALDTNDAEALSGLASALVLAGRPDEGLTLIKNAMRLDPYHPPKYLIILGAAEFGMGRYEEAVSTFRRAVKRNIDNEIPWIYLAASYGNLGRFKDAGDAVESANDLRVKQGKDSLSLERKRSEWYSPFKGGIDFSRFGVKQAQERVRAGLTEIPALKWQYLVTPRGTGENVKFEVKGATEIDVRKAKSLYDRGVTFVDARPHEGSDNKGWISGAVPLSVSRSGAPNNRGLTETTLMNILDKTDEVVFYCHDRVSQYPAFASAKALNWGYQNVFFLAEGFPSWKEAGYPVETGK